MGFQALSYYDDVRLPFHISLACWCSLLPTKALLTPNSGELKRRLHRPALSNISILGVDPSSVPTNLAQSSPFFECSGSRFLSRFSSLQKWEVNIKLGSAGYASYTGGFSTGFVYSRLLEMSVIFRACEYPNDVIRDAYSSYSVGELILTNSTITSSTIQIVVECSSPYIPLRRSYQLDLGHDVEVVVSAIEGLE